jgi:hypothetical protein
MSNNEIENLYRKEVDYMIREEITKLKGLTDLLYFGVLDEMDAQESQAYFTKLKQNVDNLYKHLTQSFD